nr:SPFH domain-containing protein [Massilia sp. JS1662]
MAIIDRVKWDGTADVLAWKYPSEELSTWTQLIVNESQEAFLVRGGVYEGPFGAGRHTLSTENIPLLRELMGLPFGGASPFSAEVWFVDKLTRLDIRWGTPDPIQLQDPKFGIMVPVRAFGQYGIRIDDAKRFLLKLVGTLPGFDTETLSDYLRGLLTTRIKTDIANAILGSGLSVLEIAPRLDDLSNALEASLAAEIAEYGIALTQFNIHSINMPEDDPAVQTLKSALARRAEMGIVGFDYQQQRRFDVLETAAANEGSAGTLMGAGVGLGLAPALGQAFAQAAQQVQAAPATSAAERIRLLKELGELRAQGILSDTEFENEKRRILAS